MINLELMMYTFLVTIGVCVGAIGGTAFLIYKLRKQKKSWIDISIDHMKEVEKIKKGE